MADIFLTNTLTRKKEKFKPLKQDNVGIYTCGPTVYSDIHIGNLRTYLSSDILRRVLEFNGFHVTLVKNITDVGHMRSDDRSEQGHDPIVTEALKQGKSPKEIAETFTNKYIEDEKRLNILKPYRQPRATDHINQMVVMIQTLIKKGFAYETAGNVYFDVKKFSAYGQLSGNTLEKMDQLLEAVRVSSETDKKDSIDFALWKKSDKGHIMKWKSPWGEGFPGWHIECSAMVMSLIGETIDIHTGGEDLIFPHHENEIAQSESVTGKKFVNIWSHSGWLLVDGKKMSRREGGTYTLQTIVDKGFDPLAFRYLALTAHYRSRLNFTWRSLEASQKALDNIYRQISVLGKPADQVDKNFVEKFKDFVNDDLETPKGLGLISEVLASNLPDGIKARTLLEFDIVLGLNFKKALEKDTDAASQQLLESREEARKEKDFLKADQIREKLAQKGFEVIDTPNGAKLKRIIAHKKLK